MQKNTLKLNWAITSVIAITCMITQGHAETSIPTVELLPNEVTISSNVKTIVGEKYGFTPYTARIPTQAYPRYKTEQVTIQEELRTTTSIPQTTWEQIIATTLPFSLIVFASILTTFIYSLCKKLFGKKKGNKLSNK